MASVYGWLITRDFFAESFDSPEDRERYDCVGVSGPSDLSDKMETELRAGRGKTFRLYDDDGECMAEGRVFGDYDGFEPLDDYGVGNWGCTDIRYRENGKWVSL